MCSPDALAPHGGQAYHRRGGMEFINRTALIVRPKRRFLEWANRLKDGPALTRGELESLETVVLIEAPEDEADLQDLLDVYAEDVFEQMLFAWHTDETAWPPNRSPHIFRDWFDVRLIDEVWDADPDAPWTDDLEPSLDCGWCGMPLEAEAPAVTVTMRIDDKTLLEGLPPGPIAVPLGDRDVPGLIPMPGSDASAEADLVFVFCGDTCADAFRKRWAQERGARLS
jgi:hypothetical protein